MTKNFWRAEPLGRDGSAGVNWGALAAEIAGLGYWRLDGATGDLVWSEGLFRLYGLEVGATPDLAGAMAAIHRDDRRRLDSLLERAVRLGEPYATTLRLRRADGTWRVLSSHTVCKRRPDGAAETVFGVVMDVTERETYRVLAENGNDLVVQTDLTGHITYMSPSVTPMTGFIPAELVGRTIADIAGPAVAETIKAAVLETLAHPGRRPVSVEYPVHRKDGRQIWLEARPAPLFDAATGKHIGTTDVVRDVTDRKTAEARLEFANILLTTQMQASPSGILAVDSQMKIISYNRRFADMWNIPSQELAEGASSRVLFKRIDAIKEPAPFLERVKYFYEHPDQEGHDDLELVDGRFIERYTVPLLTPDGASLGRAWFFTDVTAQKLSLAQALRAARTDLLTGLANRAVFIEAARHEIVQAGRGEKRFAVLCLDLDHFKDVNDTLGHPAGDELLKAVADRLRANTRQADTVARFGGDEFAIIVSDVAEASDVAILAEKLIAVLGEPFSIWGTQVHIGASIGVDLYGPDATDPETLLSHADLALYRAKSQGRGAYQFFTGSMDTEARARVTLAGELHDAIAEDQLFLIYEPQVSLATGQITGLEALLRWRHPRLGVLRPGAFIPTAEQMGLMGKLGRWALRTAIREARAWLGAGVRPPRLGVNLSAMQFKAALALEQDILAALAENDLPPGLLELELTESTLATASRESSDVLPRLRRLGISLAIDDFGAGYSSLHHLSRFPPDRIKIARTFVGMLETTPAHAAVVKAAIGFAQGLDVAVLAAGVANQAQLDQLRRWGCAEGQGPFLADPIPAAEVPATLIDGLPPAPWRQDQTTRRG